MKWILITITSVILLGCSFKPSQYELTDGGFKSHVVMVKGVDYNIYSLVGPSWTLDYYIDDRVWVMESGGYAIPAKMNKKKFKAAVEKAKNK